MREIYNYLEDLDKRRDKVFQLGKEIIKLATRSIIESFNGNFENSEKIIEEIKEKLKKFEELFDEDLLRISGDFYTTVKQEFVEAVQFLSLLKEKRIRDPKEIKVGYIEWIIGTFDAIGELSRKMYDLLINERFDEFKEFLKIFEDFYNRTIPLSVYKFVPGLRYRIDLTRKKIEEFKKILAGRM